MQMTKCKVCGGTVNIFGKHISCNYCGQIYDVGGSIVSDDEIYREAIKKQEQGTLEGIEEAKKMFESIPNYKDSVMRTIDSYKAIDNIKVAAEEKKLEEERKYLLQWAENKRKEIKNRRIKRISFGLVSIVLVGVVIFGVNSSKQKKEMKQKYNNAMELYDNQQYQEAKEAFEALDGYSDSEKYVDIIVGKLEECKSIYNKAKKLYDSGKYEDAIKEFSTINMYLDSLQYIDNCASNLMIEAENILSEEEFESAKNLINNIPEVSNKYEDGQLFLEKIEDEIMNSKYNEAIKLFNTQQYEIAKESFIALDGYKDSADYIKKIEETIIKNRYDSAVNLYNNGKLIEAQSVFMSLKGYEDSITYINEIGKLLYEKANVLYEEKKYIECVGVLEYIDTVEEAANYESAKLLMDSCKNEYKIETENEAIRILKNGTYNECSTYLNGRVGELYSTEEVGKFLQPWKPVKVSELSVFFEEEYHPGFKYESGIEDNLGEIHNNVLLGGRGMRTYYIDGKYDKISGCAFITQDAKSTQKDLEFKITNENDVVLYNLLITGGDMPKEFVVDISGVKELKIYFDGYDWSMIKELEYYGGISDLIVYSIPK